MAATMTIQDVQKAVDTYLARNTKVLDANFAKALDVSINKYARTVTKVKGQYPQFHQLLGHVVQGFKAEWQELGQAEFKSKILKNYHQKVNYPIVPAEILPSYLAELYEEGTPIQDKAIAKKIIEGMLAQVQDDLEYLSIKGVYDPANASGQFGKSLDGIETVLNRIYADTTHPAYKIPINVPDANNILDEVTKFEKKLPKFFKQKVKRIFMSETNLERYMLKYEETFGRNTNYTDGKKMKTRFGREIVGIPGLSDAIIFAFPEGNLLKLVDIIDNPPRITDTQVQDYKLKIFMEFWLGYDFAINEAVMISNTTDATEGLGDAALMAKYYPHEA